MTNSPTSLAKRNKKENSRKPTLAWLPACLVGKFPQTLISAELGLKKELALEEAWGSHNLTDLFKLVKTLMQPKESNQVVFGLLIKEEPVKTIRLNTTDPLSCLCHRPETALTCLGSTRLMKRTWSLGEPILRSINLGYKKAQCKDQWHWGYSLEYNWWSFVQVQEVEANKERLKKIEEEKERHLKSAQDNAINIRALLRQISSSDKDCDAKIEALSDKDTNLVSRLGKLEDHFYEEQRRVYDLSY